MPRYIRLLGSLGSERNYRSRLGGGYISSFTRSLRGGFGRSRGGGRSLPLRSLGTRGPSRQVLRRGLDSDSDSTRTASGIDLDGNGTISISESIIEALDALENEREASAISQDIRDAVAAIDKDASGHFSIGEILDAAVDLSTDDLDISEQLLDDLARHGAANGIAALSALQALNNMAPDFAGSLTRDQASTALISAKYGRPGADSLASVREVIRHLYHGPDKDYLLGFGTDAVPNVSFLNSANNPYPILNFDQLSDATEYEIILHDSADNRTGIMINADQVPFNLENIQDQLILGEDYRLNIRGRNAEGNWSNVLQDDLEFTAPDQATLDGLDGDELIYGFTLTADDSPTSTGDIHWGPERIDWDLVPGAVAYQVTLLDLSRDTTVFTSRNVNGNGIDLGGINFEDGNYQLQVTAVDTYGNLGELSNFDFDVDAFNEVSAVTSFDTDLDDNLHNVNRISWDAIRGAQNYSFTLKDSTGAVIFSDTLADGQSYIDFDDYSLDIDTTRKLTTLVDGDYSFTIQAHSYNGEAGRVSAPHSFTISGFDAAARVADDAISWNDGGSGNNLMDWTALDWAQSYEIRIYDNSSPSSSDPLQEFRIPADAYPSFDLESLLTDSHGIALVAGDYYFRVAGVDSDGDRALYSDYVEFTLA